MNLYKECLVCATKHSKKGKTCSWKCAGLLAHKTRTYNQLSDRKKSTIKYNTEDKDEDIKFISSLVMYTPSRGILYGSKCYRAEDRSYEWQKVILTLEGGGRFTRAVMKIQRENNFKGLGYIYKPVKAYISLDKNPEIINGAIEEYCNDKEMRTMWCFKNKTIEDYCKNDYTPQSAFKNGGFNFVWLDYCGNFTKNTIRDLMALKNRLNKDYFLFITLFKGRESLGEFNNLFKVGKRTELITMFINLIFPANLFYKHEYKKMVTYGFASTRLFKDLTERRVADEKIKQAYYPSSFIYA